MRWPFIHVWRIIPTMKQENKPCCAAAFVWVGVGDAGRNAFVLFRRDFVLPHMPETALLHLFADSRYRLRVNGTFVYAGPPRFVTQSPEFDSVDLAPYLRKGANCVTVEVNAYGASSYQTMADGRGGFIAWGAIDPGGRGSSVDLSTPGAWQCRELTAWDANAPLYSFAQNPVEILDTRKLKEEWFAPLPIEPMEWHPAAPLPPNEVPWGVLQPSTAPKIPYRAMAPSSILLSAGLDRGEQCWGFLIPGSFMGSPKTAPTGLYAGFSTWLYSPCQQEVAVGLHWGDFSFNGAEVKSLPHPVLGNRSDATLAFQKGWNHLTGMVEFLTAAEFWSFLLGLPVSSGLRPHARPDEMEPAAFSLSPMMPRDALAPVMRNSCLAGEEQAIGWSVVSGDPLSVCPARLVSWTRPASSAMCNLPYNCLDRVAIDEGGRVWVLSFEGGALGHMTLDIEAPAGTVVDVGFDDWLRADGLLDIYRTNPFVNSVERIILRGGRQQVQLFHSRGGLYVQVLVRLPQGGAEGATARLHGVGMLSTQTVQGNKGAFDSSDLSFNAIWAAACRTLVASTEDSYSDSPWRERGTYLGDCFVNAQLHPLIDPDLVVTRRAVRLFAQTLTPGGQLSCVVPASLTLPHEDFTLIWVLLLHAIWAETGDRALVEELWPVLRAVLAGRDHAIHASGLWNADGRRLYIDWGAVPTEREGRANGVLNAFRIAALDHAAELAGAIHREGEQQEFRDHAERLRTAFSRTLWLEAEGRFAAGLTAEGPMRTSAFHTNILAYRFNIGTPRQQEQVERYVLDRVLVNHSLGVAPGQQAGYADLYFMIYLLTALGEHGHVELAEALIREHYGPIVAKGEHTLPESFRAWTRVEGSRCHSWSGAPAVYLTRFMLGLRPSPGGDPDRFILAPRVSADITSASGTVPHARGPITLAWHRTDKGFSYNVVAPEGVHVEVL